jgi:IclR family mhp operon transcriptional activator
LISPKSSYRLSQTLERGLDLLAALNRFGGGAATISQLCVETGLHRTTVKRLLETLSHIGYVRAQPATNLYRLTFRVQALSHGFRDDAWITDVTASALRDLAQKIVWPCTLATLEGDELVVRNSTAAYSPLSFHPGMPGRHLPLLSTAAGRAYLAFCPEEERLTLLSMLRERMDDEDGQVQWGKLAHVLEETRSRGFAINAGEWLVEKKFGGIAVPVRGSGKVLACINIIYLLRGMPVARAIETLLPALRATAASVESELV